MADRAPKPWFQDDIHALHTGFLAGTFLRAGIKFNFVKDDLGNYKPMLDIVIPDEPGIEPVRVRVQVLADEGGTDETPQ